MRSFVKCEGAGNDFILIDDRREEFPLADSSYIERLCHRRFGIGADGLILLQTSSCADFRMRFFNSDGREGPMCGNGVRCLIRFVAELGFPETTYKIATATQTVTATFVQDQIRTQLERPVFLKPPAHLGPWDVHSVQVGAPHAVIVVPEATAAALHQIASIVRHHPYFAPHGINVNIVALQDDGSLALRTFERGVEGETWACGTGALSVVFALKRRGTVKCRFPGGELEVDADQAWIQGPAHIVFRGEF